MLLPSRSPRQPALGHTTMLSNLLTRLTNSPLCSLITLFIRYKTFQLSSRHPTRCTNWCWHRYYNTLPTNPPNTLYYNNKLPTKHTLYCNTNLSPSLPNTSGGATTNYPVDLLLTIHPHALAVLQEEERGISSPMNRTIVTHCINSHREEGARTAVVAIVVLPAKQLISSLKRGPFSPRR